MTEDQEQKQIEAAQKDALKQQARTLGIEFSPNIGLETLQERINAKLREEPKEEQPASSPAKLSTVESTHEKRLRIKKEATKLVRLRIVCMNPQKKEWQGEIFMTGNTLIGTVKKYVPFNADWHVPQCIYDMIKQRKYMQFFKTKDKFGNNITKYRLVPEFGIEVLPDLTVKELEDLARRQAMAKGGTAEAA